MNKYVLELHWLNVTYNETEKEIIASFDGAYFSGPVLRSAVKIKDKDSISLDFTEQYTIFLENFHIAKLEWGEVLYAGNIAYLKDVKIRVSKKCKVPKFLSDDFLVIDTSLHEERTHSAYLNYSTRTFSSLREDYIFNGS